MTDIRQWLAGLELEQYTDAFESNDLDVEMLPELEDADLREIGIHSLGHRKKLLKAAAALQSADAARDAAAAHDEQATPATQASKGERRQITVMFCDLVGSTALSTRLDAEDMDAVIRRFQETVTPVIHEFGGHVARFAGDGILSYFGYPNTLEREADRAIRTALKAVHEVHQAEFHPGIKSEMRVGIATGDVVIGGLYDQGNLYEAMATGETPNLAARLQSFASPGGIAVCGTTRKLASGKYSYTDEGRQSLRGFSHEVQVWLVSGMETQSTVEVEGDSTLEGRQAEIDRLTALWQKASFSEGVAVLLRGEAGVGKSKMVSELREQTPARHTATVQLFCQPYARNTPYFPVLDLLHRSMDVSADDSGELRRQRLLEFSARQSIEDPLTIALLAQFLGIADDDHYAVLVTLSPARLREETMNALVREMTALALAQPLIIHVEDLHWVDASTLEFLEVLASRIEALPVLLLMTARPEFSLDWQQALGVELIELAGLSEAAVSAIIDHIAEGTTLSADVKRQIWERSNGIPLYVEELTKSVVAEVQHIESGMITALQLDHLSVPDALQNILMARLDRLGPVRDVALQCAVIGREFERELVALVVGSKPAEISRIMQQLVDAELLEPVDSSTLVSYAFRHALLRDAAYNNLLKGRRQEIHLKIAQVLEEHYPQRVAAHPERLAHHYTRGGEFARAIPAWIAAGTAALRSSANLEAIEHLQQGLALLHELPEGAIRLQSELQLKMLLGPALIATRGFAAPEVEDLFAQSRSLCETIGTSEELFPVLRGLQTFYIVHADFDAALQIGTELGRAVEKSPSAGHELEWRWNYGSTCLFMGDLQQAMMHLQAGVPLYDQALHASHAYTYGQDPGVAAMTHLALALTISGQYERARALEADIERLAESLEHPFTLAQSRGFRISCQEFRGEIDAVRAAAPLNLEFSRAQGFPVWQGMAMMSHGWALAQSGDAAGIELAEQGYRLYAGSGAQLTKSRFLARVAETHLICGDVERGLDFIAQAIDHCERKKEHLYEPEVYTAQARLLVKQDANATDRAADIYRKALGLARGMGAKHYELTVATAFKNLELSQGVDDGEAHQALVAVLRAFEAESGPKKDQALRALQVN